MWLIGSLGFKISDRIQFSDFSERKPKEIKTSFIASALLFYTWLMKTLSPDTSPEVEQIMIEGYRKMSAARKLQIMQDLINAAGLLALGDIKRTHPKADQREILLRLAS